MVRARGLGYLRTRNHHPPPNRTGSMPTSKSQSIEIPLSERPPVRIDPLLWPIVANAERLSEDKRPIAHITVREHKDGRRIVYGSRAPARGGFLVPPHTATMGHEGREVTPEPDVQETIRAIRRVAGIVQERKLADECISSLPAEELK